MLTLEDRSKFEALIADYAKREIEWRQAVERRHAALHAILDYTNNKLNATTRAGIDHGVALQRAKGDARKIHLTKILGKIAEGTRDVRSTLSPAEVFELAVEGLREPPPPAAPPNVAETFAGPLDPEIAPTPFPLPGFNERPIERGHVTLDTNPPQRRAEDASRAFLDTFDNTDEMPEAQQLGLSHKAKL